LNENIETKIPLDGGGRHKTEGTGGGENKQKGEKRGGGPKKGLIEKKGGAGSERRLGFEKRGTKSSKRKMTGGGRSYERTFGRN